MPHPGLLYCMEFLEQNMDWLREKMDPLIQGQCFRKSMTEVASCDPVIRPCDLGNCDALPSDAHLVPWLQMATTS